MSKTIFRSQNLTVSQAASTTRYLTIIANSIAEPDATEANKTTIFRTGGTLSLFTISVVTNDRAASTLKTRKATADGSQLVSITGSTTGTFTDATNSDTVTAADDWHAQLITGAGGTTFTFGGITILFSATSNTSARIGCGSHTTSATFQTPYSCYGNAASGNNHSDRAITVRSSVTAKNFFIYVSANTVNQSTNYNSRLAAGNGNLVVTVGATTTGSFEDTTHSDSLTTGNTFSFYRVPNGAATGSMTVNQMCCDFETTDSTFYVQCGGSLTQNASVTNYYSMAGNVVANTTESNVQDQARLAFTGSKLQCNVRTNGVSANSTLKLRQNGGYGTQSVTITASTAGVFQDASNSDTIAATDTIDYEWTTGGSGTNMVISSMTMMGVEIVASTSTFVPRLMLMGAG